MKPVTGARCGWIPRMGLKLNKLGHIIKESVSQAEFRLNPEDKKKQKILSKEEKPSGLYF